MAEPLGVPAKRQALDNHRLKIVFETANYIEAGFWMLCGLIVLLGRSRLQSSPRWITTAVIALVAFGVSDIVEVQTGAWWRPWWLLVWKGACVIVIVMWLVKLSRRAHSSG